MAVDNLLVIDSISLDKKGEVMLTISDHLEWDDNIEHLELLQKKINLYLEFIENGELLENYPDAKGRNVIINIIAKYLPDKVAESFLQRVKQMLELMGYKFNLQFLEGH